MAGVRNKSSLESSWLGPFLPRGLQAIAIILSEYWSHRNRQRDSGVFCTDRPLRIMISQQKAEGEGGVLQQVLPAKGGVFL